MITDSVGKHPIYLGKPNRSMVDLCLSLSGFSPEETLVVGDRLYTDIACGINGCDFRCEEPCAEGDAGCNNGCLARP